MLRIATTALPLACAANPDIPSAAVFDSVLGHDLKASFAKGDRAPVTVTYQLLRNGPTITGVAYPKYYVWVEVRSGQQLVRVGAARLAAINKSFELTNFLPAESINLNPISVDSVFPAPLVSDIRRRARDAPPTPKRGV